MPTAGPHRADRETRLLECNVRTFLEVKNAYDQCTPEIREVVDDMIAICNSGDADDFEKRRAMHTVIEALFPALADDVLRDLNDAASQPDARQQEAEMDAQEATFATRLRVAMEHKGLTQEELAAKIGVGQSAISNMLNRRCRPQARTVARLATALDLRPADLWPATATAQGLG